jgi:hypothetical protein
MGNTLEALGIGKDFLSRTQLRERIDELDYMKLKHLCTTKKNGLQIEEATHRTGEKSLLSINQTRTDNHNIQGTQKTELPKNHRPNKEIVGD